MEYEFGFPLALAFWYTLSPPMFIEWVLVFLQVRYLSFHKDVIIRLKNRKSFYKTNDLLIKLKHNRPKPNILKKMLLFKCKKVYFNKFQVLQRMQFHKVCQIQQNDRTTLFSSWYSYARQVPNGNKRAATAINARYELAFADGDGGVHLWIVLMRMESQPLEVKDICGGTVWIER